MWKRLVNFLLGQDEALNALGGGSPKETISGTIGRGVIRGYWWAKPLAAVLDAVLGAGHCAHAAESEAAARAGGGE